MSSLHIRRRSADLWQLRVRHAGRDHYRHLHGTEPEARAAGARFLADLTARGAPPVSPATGFAAYAATWLALIEPGLAASTAARYRELLTRHLLPSLGSRRLASLAVADGLAIQRRMLEAHLAPATVFAAVRLLKAISAEATRLGILAGDPFAAIRHIRSRSVQRPVLTSDKFAGTLARVAANEADTIRDLITLALASGLRRGELLALAWGDIEPGCGALSVRASLCPVSGERKAPKTAAGARRVGLPAATAEMLRARRLRAAQGALAAGRVLDTLPVFPAADGLSYANPETISQAVARALPQGVSLHGLRHAHATVLISAGVSPRAVQERLGHADIKTTLRVYTHALPRDDAAAVAVLDQALGA